MATARIIAPTAEAVCAEWEEGNIVLSCSCEIYFVPGPLRHYGDHACPSCNSIDTGFVHEESLP